MPYDAHWVISTANDFVLAADRCMEQQHLDPGKPQLLVPAMVCAAFAIELYFKAIIALEGGGVKGHDLSDLFSSLSKNSQLSLITHCSVTESIFTQKLKGISGGFVEWRYIFEKQETIIDVPFLNGLVKSSGIVVQSILDERMGLE